MWGCDFDHCDKPAVRTEGDCTLCDRHLCATHIEKKYHKCPAWEDEKAWHPAYTTAEKKEISTLLDKINIPALLSRASSLRDGIPCSLPQDPINDNARIPSSTMGGMNYHIEIQFQDGISWLARIRRVNASSPPPELRRYLLSSEVATMKFLEKTNVPAPRVFGYSLGENNPVGVEYILVEKLPGSALKWSLATPEQRQKVVRQLADIYIELRRYPFDKMGSLNLDDSGGAMEPGYGHTHTHIGPLAHEAYTAYNPIDSQMTALGPFTDPAEFLRQSIQLNLDLIKRNESNTSRSIDAYIVHRFLLDNIPALQSVSSTHSDQAHAEKFYLTHADTKSDHILIDANYSITGLIDWEWASTEPLSQAFNSPLAFIDVANFYNGSTSLSSDEDYFASTLSDKGHNDLGNIVRRGRVNHFLNFCNGYNFGHDWEGFSGLFKGLRRALGVDAELSWGEWRGRALELYKDDTVLRGLLERVAHETK